MRFEVSSWVNILARAIQAITDLFYNYALVVFFLLVLIYVSYRLDFVQFKLFKQGFALFGSSLTDTEGRAPRNENNRQLSNTSASTTRAARNKVELLTNNTALIPVKKPRNFSLLKLKRIIGAWNSCASVGVLVGVALAISIAGPGAILWMWVGAAGAMGIAVCQTTAIQLWKVRGYTEPLKNSSLRPQEVESDVSIDNLETVASSSKILTGEQASVDPTLNGGFSTTPTSNFATETKTTTSADKSRLNKEAENDFPPKKNGLRSKTSTLQMDYLGGAPWYLIHGISAPTIAALSAVFSVIALLVAVPLVQADAIISALQIQIVANPYAIGLTMAIAIVVMVAFCAKKARKILAVLTTYLAAIYILVGFAVMLFHPGETGEFFAKIITNSSQGVSAGLGFFAGLWLAVTTGIRRGIFTHESGLATAYVYQDSSLPKHPVESGIRAIGAVFVDSFLMCTVTGFILVTFADVNTKVSYLAPNFAYRSAISSLSAAFKNLMGVSGSVFLVLVLVVFGLNAILRAIRIAALLWAYLRTSNRISPLAYSIMVLVMAVVIGGAAIVSTRTAWGIIDLTFAFVLVINLLGILPQLRTIKAVVRDYYRQLRGGVAEPVFDPICAHIENEQQEIRQNGVWF